MMILSFHRAGRTPLRRVALAAVLLAPLAACDTDALLDVEDPDVTTPPALFDPSNLAAVRASVLGDFAAAYSGAGQTNGLTINSGLMSDEFYFSGTFGQTRELDVRAVSLTNGAVATNTRNLYRALRFAEIGAESYAENQPNTAAHAEMLNLQGFLYIGFAENFCGAVPFSREAGGEFDYGPPQTTAQILARAIAAFDQALTVATAAGSTAQQNLARVGKARALVNLGPASFAEAAALVSGVPTGFSYVVEHAATTARQNNGVWGLTHGRREVGMASAEGHNGLAYRVGPLPAADVTVAPDPRVPWAWRNGSAAGSAYRHFFQKKFPAQETPLPLATGIEARLIQAEAALAAGASNAYLPILNTLRAGIGLAALADPGTAAGRVNQFFAERAFWLYATAHRLGDMRRLVRQYGRAKESVYPTGDFLRPASNGTMRNEGTYGTQASIPITFDELNNPAFREAQEQCDPNAA